jgi:hypothetical protein
MYYHKISDMRCVSCYHILHSNCILVWRTDTLSATLYCLLRANSSQIVSSALYSANSMVRLSSLGCSLPLDLISSSSQIFASTPPEPLLFPIICFFSTCSLRKGWRYSPSPYPRLFFPALLRSDLLTHSLPVDAFVPWNPLGNNLS